MYLTVSIDDYVLLILTVPTYYTGKHYNHTFTNKNYESVLKIFFSCFIADNFIRSRVYGRGALLSVMIYDETSVIIAAVRMELLYN